MSTQDARPKMWVKKEGDVCRLYMNSQGVLARINSFDDEPAGAFPQTMSKRELEHKYGASYNIVYFEPPKGNAQRIVRDPRVEAEVARLAGEEPPAPQTKVVPMPKTVAATTNYTPAILEKALLEFRILVGKYEFAGDEVKPRLKIEIEAIASFMVKLFPDVLPKLQEIKESEKASGGFSLE